MNACMYGMFTKFLLCEFKALSVSSFPVTELHFNMMLFGYLCISLIHQSFRIDVLYGRGAGGERESKRTEIVLLVFLFSLGHLYLREIYGKVC